MTDTSRVITAVCWSLRPWYFVLGHPNNPVPEVRAQVRDLPEQNLCWACNPVCLKIWEVVLVLLGVFCRRFREIIHGGFSRWQQMGNHRSLQKSDGSRRERNRWADWVVIPETYLTGSSKQDFRICPLLPPSNQNFYEAHLAQIHLLGGQLRVIPARIRSLWPRAKRRLERRDDPWAPCCRAPSSSPLCTAPCQDTGWAAGKCRQSLLALELSSSVACQVVCNIAEMRMKWSGVYSFQLQVWCLVMCQELWRMTWSTST